LKIGDNGVRLSAGQALTPIGNPEVPTLEQALKDEHAYVRQDAIRVLRNIGDRSAVLALVMALRDRESDVRSCAIYALAAIGDVFAIPALIETLKDDDVFVRRGAAFALGAIGNGSAVPALIKMSKDDDWFARRDAVEAIGKIGDKTTLPRMVLASSWLSAQERIELLGSLRGVPSRDRWSPLRYTFADTRTLCQSVLNEKDMEARDGARTVLNWLDGDRNLLIASQRDTTTEARQLTRASQSGATETQTGTLLQGSSEPEPNVEPRPSLWQRLMPKRKNTS
jgi:hypothetical protein